MDVESPELSSALDMYADNATNGDSDVRRDYKSHDRGQ